MRKGELFDDVFDEVDGIGLVVTAVDFKSPDAGCIIDCGVLIALCHAATFAFEDQELDVDLDMMARNLFLIPLCVNGPRSGFAGKTAQAVAPQNAIDTGVRDSDVVITPHVPNDANGTEMVLLSEVEDLLDDLGRGLIRV